MNEEIFLLIWFDSRLSYYMHIQYVAARVAPRLDILRILRGTDWDAGKIQILQLNNTALIKPVILYGCIAFASAGISNDIRL